MKETTAYQYRKRIKALRDENDRLRSNLHNYRRFASDVFEHLADCGEANGRPDIPWILRRSKSLLWTWIN